MSQKRLSPDQRERIVAAYVGGGAVVDIARAIGFGVTAIYATLAKAGIELRGEHGGRRVAYDKAERRAAIIRRFKDRVPVTLIAAEFGMPRQLVNKILKRHGCASTGRARCGYGKGIADKPPRRLTAILEIDEPPL